MVSLRSFWTRYRKSLSYQWKMIRTIADWTVIVYLIIPSLVIFSIFYASWWRESPEWITLISLFIPYMLLYFFCTLATVQLFVEEADSVFFIKKPKYFNQMKLYGYVYSIIRAWGRILGVIGLFLPFFIQYYHLTWMSIFVLILYLFGFSALFLLINYFRQMVEARWKLLLLNAGIFSVTSTLHIGIFLVWSAGWYYVLIGFSVICLCLSVIYMVRIIRTITYLDYDLRRSAEEKGKYSKMIISFSPDIEKPVILKRKKPWLFRGSKRIFKKRSQVNGFCELFIKVFIRNYTYWGSYLRMISILAVAMIVVPPIWLKVVLFFIFFIMMNVWLSNVWNKVFLYHPITKKYTESDAYYKAKSRSLLWLKIIGTIILILIVSIGLRFINHLNL